MSTTMANRFKYTENMKNIFQGEFSRLHSYYCKEDIERAIEEVQEARKDSREFRLNDLRKVCEAIGADTENISNEQLVQKAQSLLEETPTREEMKKNLLHMFYDKYLEFPRATDFMERIVRRLAKEYEKDTVRVAILKKFLVGAGKETAIGVSGEFKITPILTLAKELYVEKTEKAGENETEEVSDFVHLSKEKQREYIISKIDDTIFNSISTRVELSSVDIFKCIVKRMKLSKKDDNIAFDAIVLREETKNELNLFLNNINLYDEAMSDDEKLGVIGDAIKSGELSENDAEKGLDSFIKMLEKDFTDQTKKIERIDQKGKKSNVVDLYKNDKRDVKKKIRNREKDFKLLQLCDDFAGGNFRAQKRTKRYLYYFAIMFEMTFSLDGVLYDDVTDIEKNLFYDYYNDNLLRMLEQRYSNPKTLSSFEREPIGDGINYKSFAEAIYLYYLYHTELKMSPGKKINTAEKMIAECIKKVENPDKIEKLDKKDKTDKAQKREKAERKSREVFEKEHTKQYKEEYMEELLRKKEDHIVDYVVKNYLIIPLESGEEKTGIAAEQNTAFDKMEILIEILDEEYEFNHEELGYYVVQEKEEEEAEKVKKSGSSVFKNNFSEWTMLKYFETDFLGDNEISSDQNFIKVVRLLDQRLHENNGGVGSLDKERAIHLLNILAIESSETDAKSRHILLDRLKKRKIVSEGNQLRTALTLLKNIGYDIVGDSVKGYYLGQRNYEDERLNSFFKYVSTRILDIPEKAREEFDGLIKDYIPSSKKITRNTFISTFLNYYISIELIDQEFDKVSTFSNIFENFSGLINEYLEAARYQPFSEKNIFDLYVVMTIYFYLVDIGRDFDK